MTDSWHGEEGNTGVWRRSDWSIDCWLLPPSPPRHLTTAQFPYSRWLSPSAGRMMYRGKLNKKVDFPICFLERFLFPHLKLSPSPPFSTHLSHHSAWGQQGTVWWEPPPAQKRYKSQGSPFQSVDARQVRWDRTWHISQLGHGYIWVLNSYEVNCAPFIDRGSQNKTSSLMGENRPGGKGKIQNRCYSVPANFMEESYRNKMIEQNSAHLFCPTHWLVGPTGTLEWRICSWRKRDTWLPGWLAVVLLPGSAAYSPFIPNYL